MSKASKVGGWGKGVGGIVAEVFFLEYAKDRVISIKPLFYIYTTIKQANMSFAKRTPPNIHTTLWSNFSLTIRRTNLDLTVQIIPNNHQKCA